MPDKLIIAAAGSGKTTYLIHEALKFPNEKILITTFTEANEQEIRNKFIELYGFIPTNVTIQTWFSLLLQHGVKPYQSVIYEGDVRGLLLVNKKSGFKYNLNGRPIYFGENDIPQYYFNSAMQIYSDKLSKFVCKANSLSNGLIIDRLCRIYSHIYIDEIQDLAGYDLEFIKLLLMSPAKVIMVGDPRQVTYHTHAEAKNKKYEEGKIEEFILEQCKHATVDIDKTTLSLSYRNSKEICELANQIYPNFVPCGYVDRAQSEHEGVYFVARSDVDFYLKLFSPVQLRDKISVDVNPNYRAINFGDSKGLTFDRVLLYPTKPMLEWIIDHNKPLKYQSRSRLYVAITRARYSVGIVVDNCNDLSAKGIQTFAIDH